MNSVVISLGSNISPQENINQALVQIKERFAFLNQSEFIQTKPIGYTEQDDFINGSVMIETEEDQGSLKETLKDIEKELGRTKSTIKFGPRTIDRHACEVQQENGDSNF